MILAKNVVKSFGEQQVIKNISISFETGKTNLVIGRSGSGKTVLLKMLVGLIKPDAGQIFYDGEEFYSLDKRELQALRMRVGMLFQGSALFDSLSVEENVRFPMDMFTHETRAEKQKRVDYCLDRVGL
ncbi:MAG: ATP-binding cassette domain-containing protein, partial [Saprospiraceae bacterium]|nr:ATP-binding cassette domain-containing protein [Saprospiraceae bacterium]